MGAIDRFNHGMVAGICWDMGALISMRAPPKSIGFSPFLHEHGNFVVYRIPHFQLKCSSIFNG